MGIIFAIIGAFSLTGMYVFTKLLVDNQKYPIINAGIAQLIAGLLLLIPLPFVDVNFDFSTKAVLLVTFSSLIYTAHGILNFTSYKYLDLSIISILAQLSTVVAFLGSVIVFSEDITPIKVIGASLILIGNSLVFIIKGQGSELSLKGIALKTTAATILGIAFLIDAYSTTFSTLILYGAIVFIVPGVLTLVYTRKSLSTISEAFALGRTALIVTGTIGAFGFYSILKAYSLEEKTIVMPIISIYTILVVVSGVILFKERKMLAIKFISTIISIVGVIILGTA